jgi:hypothetical protein
VLDYIINLTLYYTNTTGMPRLKLILCTVYVNNIQTLVFLMRAHSVLWETGTESFYITFEVRKVPKMVTACLRRLVAGMLLLNPVSILVQWM